MYIYNSYSSIEKYLYLIENRDTNDSQKDRYSIADYRLKVNYCLLEKDFNLLCINKSKIPKMIER